MTCYEFQNDLVTFLGFGTQRNLLLSSSAISEESWSWQQCGIDSGSFVAEVVCLITTLFRIPFVVSCNSSDPEHCHRYCFKCLLWF